MVSDKVVERLIVYRRLLRECTARGQRSLFSHELAKLAGYTAAQVRRDVMVVGYSGSPAHGYLVSELLDGIGAFLGPSKRQGIALVGVGNLGRAILSHFAGRTPLFGVVAAFDADPSRVNRVVHGCRCYPVEELDGIVRGNDLRVAVIAVPASEAQRTADLLCGAGIRGLINFAPIRLRTPADVYVENVDLTLSVEKVAYFACERAQERNE